MIAGVEENWMAHPIEHVHAHARAAAVGYVLLLAGLATCPSASSKEPDSSDATAAAISASLAGRYENSAQVARGKTSGQSPPPQHVTITIERTPQEDWQIWRVHMDVDPEVAQLAGSETSLDAVWAMNLSRDAAHKSLQLTPYTLTPSVDVASVKASEFDQKQWLSLDACVLGGHFAALRIVAQAPPDEMCAAATMGLGGKRAFLPTSVEREGNWLHVQLIYFGKPWRVDAQRAS
jgi:hypothetical protein